MTRCEECGQLTGHPVYQREPVYFIRCPRCASRNEKRLNLDLDLLEKLISKYDCEEWSAEAGHAIIEELRRSRAVLDAATIEGFRDGNVLLLVDREDWQAWKDRK